MNVITCTDNSYKAFTAIHLLPLNKNPGTSQIGVGEVLHWITRKVIMYKPKKDIKDAAGSLQVWAGQEAPIHAIYDKYQQDET